MTENKGFAKKENINTKEGVIMHRLFKWIGRTRFWGWCQKTWLFKKFVGTRLFKWAKEKAWHWAIDHNIDPLSFVFIYFGGWAMSWIGSILFSYGLTINSNLLITGTVIKLVGTTMPGLYVVFRGKRLNWRIKPIILLIIAGSILFFTWRVPSRIKELIYWWLIAAK